MGATLKGSYISQSAQVAKHSLTLDKLEQGAHGQILFYDDVQKLAKLSPGTAGQFLKTRGAGLNPIWDSVGISPMKRYWQMRHDNPNILSSLTTLGTIHIPAGTVSDAAKTMIEIYTQIRTCIFGGRVTQYLCYLNSNSFSIKYGNFTLFPLWTRTRLVWKNATTKDVRSELYNEGESVKTQCLNENFADATDITGAFSISIKGQATATEPLRDWNFSVAIYEAI